jgi:pantoate--beta-alanine ligase
MILFKRSSDLRKWLDIQSQQGKKTGFVPTMGALHEGHLKLVSACRKSADLSICSIFVNPAQFNDPKDFEKYPVSIENDIELLTRAGTDVLFLPAVEEIYPNGDKGLETYDLGALENLLEGQFRPGHYQGVCQVMSRLLKLIRPDKLFMGQKDFQQCLVVQHLIKILHLPVEFHTVPTIREPDGLALSSRNRRLTADQRKNATAISAALLFIKENLAPGSNDTILGQALEIIHKAHFRTDYVVIARTSDLEPIKTWDGHEKAVALFAGFQGEVRLIDNILLN